MPPHTPVMDQNTNLLSETTSNVPSVSQLSNGHTNTNDGKPVDKVKCVLVGDGAVGKTSLIVSYTTNGYPTEYMPTAFDDYSVLVTVDSTPVQMQLCDTAGQDDFDAIRPLCYPNTDVFLLCFSVVSPTSYNNIVEKWVPEIRRHCQKCPLVLVGTQCDLRNDVKVLIELAKYDEKPIPEEDAIKLSHNIGAAYYLECSALTQKNLKDVFDHAILASLNYNAGGDLSRGKPMRKSSRKKYNLTTGNTSAGHCGGGSSSGTTLKKAGWKKFCCFL